MIDIQKKIDNKTLTHNDMEHIDKLDNTLARGMIKVEKQFKGDLHKIPWSIELRNRIKYISYWWVVVSQLLTKVSHAERSSKITKHFPQSYAIAFSTVKDVSTKRRNARKERRKKITQSHKRRRQHLLARATALECF